MTADRTPDAEQGAEVEAERGDVWQEADGVLLLCVQPGVEWQDFRGDRFPWDAPTITRPLRRLLDAKGNLDARLIAEAERRGAERVVAAVEAATVARNALGWAVDAARKAAQS